MPAHKEIVQIITPELYAEMNKAEEISDNQIVTVASDIVKNAQQNLSLNAARILRVLYTLINQNDIAGRTYRFDLQSYANAFGLSNAKIYRVMTESCKELRDSFILPIGKGRVTGLIERAQVTDNEVQIMIDPALLTVYKKDKLRLSYRLKNIAGLAYGITFKFYDLLVMKLGDQDEVFFKIGLDDLKDFLEISNKYAVYKDFKRRILVNIVNDINGFRPDRNSRIMENNNCNLHVEFEEEKESRKVVAICFKVTRVKDNEIIEAEIIQDFTDTLSEQESFAYNWLRDQLKIAPYVLQDCIKEDRKDPANACFLKIYDYIVYMLTDENRSKKIRSKSAWAAKALRDRYYNVIEKETNLFDDISLPEYSVRVDMLKDQNITDNERISELIRISEEKIKLDIPDSGSELASYSEAYISSNIDYVSVKYNGKVSQERISLIVEAIRNDYAGFIAMLKNDMEAEKEAARIAKLKEQFMKMTIEELTKIKGEDEELAQKILQDKQAAIHKEQEASAENLFKKFMEQAPDAEKQAYKLKAIEAMRNENKFMFQATAKHLRDKGFDGNLEDATLELLMTASAFSSKFKAIWKNDNIDN